jgi:hypothetical protein
VDAHTPLDPRLLSPVYVLSLIFFVSVSWNISRLKKNPRLWWGILAISLVLIFIKSGHTMASAIHLRQEGRGYTNRVWRKSETIAYVKSLPGKAVIYSNGPDAIRFLTGKESTYIPRKVSASTLLSNVDFESQIRAMQNDLTRNDAIIVYFDNISARWYLPSKKELENLYRIPVLLRLQDGTVYRAKLR